MFDCRACGRPIDDEFDIQECLPSWHEQSPMHTSCWHEITYVCCCGDRHLSGQLCLICLAFGFSVPADNPELLPQYAQARQQIEHGHMEAIA